MVRRAQGRERVCVRSWFGMSYQAFWPSFVHTLANALAKTRAGHPTKREGQPNAVQCVVSGPEVLARVPTAATAACERPG